MRGEGGVSVWYFFMVLSQRRTQIQLSTTWNSVPELKPKKSMYPWHRGLNTSWENDFLIIVSALPGKGFKLVSRNQSKDTGIWMPLHKRELTHRKEETLYHRLLNSCNPWNKHYGHLRVPCSNTAMSACEGNMKTPVPSAATSGKSS